MAHKPYAVTEVDTDPCNRLVSGCATEVVFFNTLLHVLHIYARILFGSMVAYPHRLSPAISIRGREYLPDVFMYKHGLQLSQMSISNNYVYTLTAALSYNRSICRHLRGSTDNPRRRPNSPHLTKSFPAQSAIQSANPWTVSWHGTDHY